MEYVKKIGIDSDSQKPYCIMYNEDMINDLKSIVNSKSPVASVLSIDKVS